MDLASPLPDVMVSPSVGVLGGFHLEFNSVWVGFALGICILVYATAQSSQPYGDIPAVGSTGIFSSYLSAIHYIKNAKSMLQEGYNKYKGKAFRVPEMTRWHVMVTGERLVEELRKAPEDVLSIKEATNELLNTRYTLAPNLADDWYPVALLDGKLARSLGSLLPDLQNEVTLAFEDYIPVTDDWIKVKVHDTMLKVVSRASNRVFVGLPICREPEYIKLNIRFTRDVIIGARVIGLLPDLLKPFAGQLAKRLFTGIPRAIRTAMKHIEPIIEERQSKINEYGFDYPDKPNDMLSWLMDVAKSEERSAKNLTLRLLLLNLGAIHTTSLSFTHALYHLASRTEYIQPLREEIEAVTAAEGWTKASVTRMRKLDSFLRECQRVSSFSLKALTRKAVTDYTFSDGTRVPRGAYVSAAISPLHSDDQIYQNGNIFNGFRFSEMRDEEGQATKNQLISTSPDYLAFGHGKHACPGRFLAAAELKAMLAHIVLTYDIKLEQEGVRPADEYFWNNRLPNRRAQVLFRKRQI